jgi:drug/metabolite transporter (DMT)-like permease
MQNHRGLPEWTILFFLIGAWGSSFAFTKIAVQTIPPIWVPAIRLCIAAGLLTMVLGIRKAGWPRGFRNWLWLGWFAVIGNILPFFLITWATRHVPSSLAGILMAVNPLLVLLLARALLPDEPVRANHVAGFLIGFAGVVTLIGPNALSALGGAGTDLMAQLALVGAALGYALMNVTARLAPNMDLIAKSAGTMVVAAILSIAAAMLFDPGGLASVTPDSYFAVAILGIFPTALATIGVYWLVSRTGARFLATSNYSVPVFAILVGWIFLKETLQTTDFAGFALISVGILLSETGLMNHILRRPSAGPRQYRRPPGKPDRHCRPRP